MKIDYDYINEILKVFLETTSLTVDWNNFEELRSENKDKFIFHIQIMTEKGLISDTDGNTSFKSLGLDWTCDGIFIFSAVPWRLTANGHDFASAMNKADVLSTIRERFKDEGLSVVVDVAKQLANNQAKKLLGLPE